MAGGLRLGKILYLPRDTIPSSTIPWHGPGGRRVDTVSFIRYGTNIDMGHSMVRYLWDHTMIRYMYGVSRRMLSKISHLQVVKLRIKIRKHGI